MEICTPTTVSSRRAFRIAEVSEMLAQSESSVRRAIRRGDLQAVTFGRSVLITAESVDRLLRSPADIGDAEPAADAMH